MEAWNPEQLKQQAERTKSDTELLKSGSQYVHDKGAKEPRLHLHEDDLARAYDENTRRKIEKGELVGVGHWTTDIYDKIKSIAKEKGLNTEEGVERHIVKDLPDQEGGSTIFPGTILQFLRRTGGAFITVKGSERSLLPLRCGCGDYDHGYIYVVDEESKNLFLDQYGKLSGKKEVAFYQEISQDKTAYETMVQAGHLIEKEEVGILSKGEYEQLLEEIARKIISQISEDQAKAEEHRDTEK